MISIRHLELSDLANYSGVVYGDFRQTDGGLQSEDLFGESSSESYKSTKQFREQEHKRAYIPLERPCINYAKTRSGGTLLFKILNINKKLGQDFLSFRKGLDKNTGEVVELSKVGKESANQYLIGSEALLWFIDQFNLEESIVNCLSEDLGLSSSTIVNFETDFHIIGNYWFNPTDRWIKEFNSSEISFSEILAELIETSEERICLLLNLKSKENLYHLFFNFLVVLPMEMRPRVASRVDPLTKMYSRVVMANMDLKQKSNYGVSVNDLKESYKELQYAVTNVTYKNLLRRSKKDAGSIMERLAGKKGHIRGLLEGKRQDYSGRSVIIVDPELSVDECGIPADMAPKLFQYHLLKEEEEKSLSSIRSIIGRGPIDRRNNLARIKKRKLNSRVPVILNRAPSLHNLSLQAYYGKIFEGCRAIRLHPLGCEAYNADFDGDQMGVHVPNSPEAVEEASILMSPLYNPYNPVTGEIIIKPRHEILLGLNICCKDFSEKEPTVYSYPGSMEEVYDKVINHEIKVYDIIKGAPCKEQRAGCIAIMAHLPRSLWDKIPIINDKTIDSVIQPLIDSGHSVFKKSIDALVKLGFHVATLYSPTINLVNMENIPTLKEPFEDFNGKLDLYIQLYNDGLMDDEEYNRKFHIESTKVANEVKKRVESGAIPESECFSQLVTSGARGKVNNLVQIFAHKGVVNKSSSEAFPVMIENSFVDGLTPLEHFMTAFSARQDIMSRSKKTAETGYASRLMCHTDSEVVVDCEDCGTAEGLTISKHEISVQIRIKNEAEKAKVTDHQFYEIIEGRYEAGTNIYITPELAREYVATRSSVTIRSVLTCQSTCCSKCYGKDIGHHSQHTVVGHAVGMIAAQGIGGLATQLSMDTFQSGGVASNKGIASDFERMNALLNMSDISAMTTRFPIYDPIAWKSGRIISNPISATKQRVQIEGSKRAKILPIDLDLKEMATYGEPICLERGDLYIEEVLKYSGIEEAQKQLAYQMYLTYFDKEAINFKHFECLVAGMTLYLVMKSEKGLLDVGKFYLKSEIAEAENQGDEIMAVAKIKGVKETRVLHSGLVSNFELENIVKGLSRAVVTGNSDKCITPISSLIMGKVPKIGAEINPDYVRERQAQFMA